MNNLANPASDNERAGWKSSDLDDVNLDQLPNRISNNNNFEDYLDFYALLSEKVNRTSSRQETNNFYCIKKNHHRKEMLVANPEQNADVHKVSHVTN